MDKHILLSTRQIEEEVGEDYDLGQILFDEQHSFLLEQVHAMELRYEKRYKTVVDTYALCGTVGTWRGNSIGGKMVSRNAVLDSGEYDGMEVYVNESGELEIQLIHHDASHYMNIYFITEAKLKKAGLPLDTQDWDYSDFRKLREKVKPVKADKLFKEAYGIKKEKAGKV